MKGRRELSRELHELLGGMVFVLTALTLLFLLAGRPFWVDGSSMSPTLEDGELIVVRSLAYRPRQGDIVVLIQPSFRETSVVKRVVATGGQTVEIDYAAGTVRVDREALAEPYVREWMVQQPYQSITRLTVPEGHVFVLGDNRNHSDDSRDPDCGTVDERLVLGHAAAVIFPAGRWKLL